jgi:hypothetical protein
MWWDAAGDEYEFTREARNLFDVIQKIDELERFCSTSSRISRR